MTPSYSIEQVREEIKSAREKKTAVVFKNMFMDVPEWKQFIEHADYQSAFHSDFEEDDYYKSLGRIFKRHNFYLQVADAVTNNPDMHNFFPQTSPVISFFDQVFEQRCNGGPSFFNISGIEPDVNTHDDEWDNVSWQCIGTTWWEVRHNREDVDPHTVFELNPGDIIVIPEGVQHAVVKKTARAGITLSYNVVQKEYVNRLY